MSEKKPAQEWADSLSDEDLGMLLEQAHGVSARGIAHGVVDGLIENFSDPVFRVEFFAAMIATVPCTKARLPFIPSMLIALAAGKAAKWAYLNVEEIKSKLDGSRADRGA